MDTFCLIALTVKTTKPGFPFSTYLLVYVSYVLSESYVSICKSGNDDSNQNLKLGLKVICNSYRNSHLIPFGVIGRFLETTPRAYGWSQGTLLDESSAHCRVQQVLGLGLPWSRVPLSCSECALALTPTGRTPSMFGWHQGLNPELLQFSVHSSTDWATTPPEVTEILYLNLWTCC